ncbi:helix-turn-helix transcriptional regulator [Photobacterium halotolerans]|uniref:AlpA family phage regulatory protein n=1 Tax=Photobacterium halotolerans TaxID=265726 RepID=A0A7X5AQF7_9GAMM|nr:hypothetical protein [Photobacterium halotolerans]NAW63964.1 hypothetical protein [Photobacterium halotolerans]
MFNYTCYPTIEVSYKGKEPIIVTPSQFKSDKDHEQSPKTLTEATDQSTPQLISHKEVLAMFQVSSKATIYKWRQNRGFPDPVTLMPLRWLRSAVEEWKDNVGRCER